MPTRIPIKLDFKTNSYKKHNTVFSYAPYFSMDEINIFQMFGRFIKSDSFYPKTKIEKKLNLNWILFCPLNIQRAQKPDVLITGLSPFYAIGNRLFVYTPDIIILRIVLPDILFHNRKWWAG